jgi:hypothetical protein
MEPLKLINYLIDMCSSCPPCTMVPEQKTSPPLQQTPPPPPGPAPQRKKENNNQTKQKPCLSVGRYSFNCLAKL